MADTIATTVDQQRIAAAWAELVSALGYSLEGDHLRDTPARVARFLAEWHTQTSAPPKLTDFERGPYTGLVATGGIRFYSMCAHHGLPFYGEAIVGYIPTKRIVGLSKLARVVDHFARRFQTQEDITAQVAAYLNDNLFPEGVAVVLKAEHLCMSMRGIERPGHSTVTSEMLGRFRDDPAARAEFIALTGAGR